MVNAYVFGRFCRFVAGFQNSLAPQAHNRIQFRFSAVQYCLAEFLNLRLVSVNGRRVQWDPPRRAPSLLGVIPICRRPRIEDHFPLATLAYCSFGQYAALGAVQFENILATVVRNAKERIHGAHSTVLKYQRRDCTVFRRIAMNHSANMAAYRGYSAEEHLE